MPNTNAPRGFRPVRYKDGKPYTGAVNRYFVPASDATALFIGDPVVLAGNADADGVPTATRATAAGGAFITGVMVGIAPTTRDTPTFRAASTAAYILVADDPDLMFECQEDAVGGALAATSVGLNADFIVGAGSTVTGLSGCQLDSSTAATTNTLQFRIAGFTQRADNEIGANAKMNVFINLHTSRNLTGI